MAEDIPTIAPDIAPDIVETLPTHEDIVESLPIHDEIEILDDVILPELTPPEPKRKPGRPAGSRNKGPAKPRPKRVVVSEAVEYAPEPPPATPRWDAQHQPIPTKATTEMAELMLRMLSGQAMERQRRKDEQRRAWFS